MKFCAPSRAMGVSGLIRTLLFAVGALIFALHTQVVRAGDCDEGVAQDLFQDCTKEGKDKKPKPPHRLVPAPCEGCKDLFDDLQRALDDCNALQLKDAEKGLSDSIPPTGDSKKRLEKQAADALDALGQPADGGKAAKDQQQKDANDKSKKETHWGKTKLKKEIKRLAGEIQKHLKDCTNAKTGVAPKPEGGTSPTGGGGESHAGAPPGEEVLPTLPKCWKKGAKDKFYQELKDAEEELDADDKALEKFDPNKKSPAAAKIAAKMKEAKALREAAKKIEDCPEPEAPKNMLPGPGTVPKQPEKTPSGKTALPGGAEDSCAFLISTGKIKIDSEGTGETIGHIANLVIENLTDQPIECGIRPMVFESISGKNQHYACLENRNVKIDPHGKVTVQMKGVCIARNRPPVSKGVTGDLMINEGNPAIAQNPNGHISTKDAGELLRVCSSKYKAAEKLQQDGAFKDFPYHDKQKQLDIVVQWLVWSDPRICETAGAPPAKKEDFKKVIYKQVEEHGPMTPDAKKKIDKGADTMWDGIELASAKAKDLEPEETPAGGSTTEEGPIGQPEYVGQTQAKNPTPTPAKPKPGGGKTTGKEKTTPKPVEPPKKEPKKEEPKGGTTQEKPKDTYKDPPDTEKLPRASYPYTKETDCGTITIAMGKKGDLIFDFKPKTDAKCPCKEFGWIQHFRPTGDETAQTWHYDNGVQPSVIHGGSGIGAISHPSKAKQPTQPPPGEKLEEWDENPWYGGTTDPTKPEDFGKHPTPQTHVSDKPSYPNTTYRMQLVCVTTGEVLLTWAWGPFEEGNESPDKVGGKSVPPP